MVFEGPTEPRPRGAAASSGPSPGRSEDRATGMGDARAQDPAAGGPRYEGAGVMAGVVLLLLLGALVVVLVAQNVDRVTFELLWWDGRVPLAVLLLVTALLTLALDQVVGLVWRRRRRRFRTLSSSPR